MWRHAANAALFVSGTNEDYAILGPLRGGGELVELGFLSQTPGTTVCRYAAALTGSPSATIENLRAGNSLILRSNDVSAVFGVPTYSRALINSEFYRFVVPLSVRMDAGSHFVVVGIRVEGLMTPVYTVAWALAIERKV